MLEPKKKPSELPLCVDLDGTLIKSDLLIEALLQLSKTNFWALLMAPLWLMKGKAYFKHEVFRRTKLQVETLPFHEEFLNFLQGEKARGRELVLATASPATAATQIADHLGLFSRVIASGEQSNLAGKAKAEALTRLYGGGNFAYAGNARVDLKVWRQAGAAYVVSPSDRLARQAGETCAVERVFKRSQKPLWRLVIKAVRVHQWAKNVLIFVPLALAHQISSVDLIFRSLLAFAGFVMVSSSVYLLNDLLDLDSDRAHPDNRHRPFASGELPLVYGIILSPLLVAFGATIALSVSPALLAVVAGYYLLTMAYSFHLKQVVLADVLILAFLYSWRVMAGAIATGIPISAWLLTFSGFVFLSLALVKRCSEIILMEKKSLGSNSRRGYRPDDLSQLVSFGTSSGYISVLVLALYINSEQVNTAYRHPMALWLACPFLLYWISRIWLKAHRGKMHSDPLVFALKDRVSYIMIGIIVMIWIAASGYLG